MLRRFLIRWGLSTAFLLSSLGAQEQKKTPAEPSSGASKQATAKSPARAAPPKNPASTARRTRRTTRPAARKRAARTASAAQAQMRPTRERYAQIQAALATAGYFRGTPNGEWGANSVEALQSFQRDHGLEPTGKIDALSLIELGLGPKYSVKNDGAKNDGLDAGAAPPE